MSQGVFANGRLARVRDLDNDNVRNDDALSNRRSHHCRSRFQRFKPGDAHGVSIGRPALIILIFDSIRLDPTSASGVNVDGGIFGSSADGNDRQSGI